MEIAVNAMDQLPAFVEGEASG
jgi:hypothetical protein